MKNLVTCLMLLLTVGLVAQPIETHVSTSGLSLKDSGNTDRIVLDGNSKYISIIINDSLILDIHGGLFTHIKLINTNSLTETGMELGPDGSFAFGEFDQIPVEARSPVLNLRNGLFRPAPDTEALATGSTERLRITSNGDVGIGTPFPIERLDIEGGIRIGFIQEDITLENILVAGPDGIVRYRPLSSIFPPLSEGSQQQSDILHKLQIQNQLIQELAQRVAQLENE